ncbi:fibronectin type III domain-containing protein [Robertkochia aurantiaca]|uniref:fibronectin type III domain-containing protein n=1 Tax=Robertkochia aurantiaca TaxID=2873700 RepID=UPI001CCBB94F|nr:fibronectin type III domain-containing protein [Robertkochia sp. 3YJGBD-33]
MRRLFPSLYFLILLFSPISAQTSDDPSSDAPSLYLKIRNYGDSIALRWVPRDYTTWQEGNRLGYIVERISIDSSGNNNTAEDVKKTERLIRPRIKEEWKELAGRNPMGAIVAQALYGENFVTGQMQAANISNLMESFEEAQRRFAFAAYASDRDYQVAMYAGLGFIDHDVHSEGSYIFSVRLANSENRHLVSAGRSQNYPRPPKPALVVHRGLFLLNWNYEDYLPFYFGYDIEISYDGSHFSKLNKVPVTRLDSTKEESITYSTPIEKFGIPVWFRIRGMGYFGEYSQPSQEIMITPELPLEANPVITETKLDVQNSLTVSWEFPDSLNIRVQEFRLMRANSPVEEFKQFGLSMTTSQRTASFRDLEPVNYFKIQAVSSTGNFTESEKFMIQLKDTIPPDIPRGLKGEVDSLGNVLISWERNTENDLKGYHLLRSEDSITYMRINRSILTDEKASDHVSMKSFKPEVYYKLVAVDQRYNESVASPPLILRVPDKIPPSSAAIISYRQIGEKGIELNIQGSSSGDAVQVLIHRNTGKNWEVIGKSGLKGAFRFIDSLVPPDTDLEYSLTVADESGNISTRSPILRLRSLPKFRSEGNEEFYAETDRDVRLIKLKWKLVKTPAEIRLYRKVNAQDLSLYRKWNQWVELFEDELIYPNSELTYRLDILYADGSKNTPQSITLKY